MKIELPPEFEQFVKAEVINGRYSSTTEVLKDALRLLRSCSEILRERKSETAAGIPKEHPPVRPSPEEEVQDRGVTPARLRAAIATYYETLRRDPVTGSHRDPFIQWLREVDSDDPSVDLRLKVLLILVNARFDQRTRAESALANTRAVFEAGLLQHHRIRRLNLAEIPTLKAPHQSSPEEWRRLFRQALPMLEDLSDSVIRRRGWTFRDLLAEMKGRKVPRFGDKTTRLAVRWLSELVPELKIDMSDSEVPVDTLVFRVAARLGIVDPSRERYWGAASPAARKIQEFAKQTFPENPSRLDEPMWMMGREFKNGGYCFPTRPYCDHGCIFSTVCPRHFYEQDPVAIGYGPDSGKQQVSRDDAASPPDIHRRPKVPGSGGKRGFLVVVSCANRKIWDTDRAARIRVPARDAYASSFFEKNRRYAEMFGDSWCILSSKYGLILPHEEIENYNVTFKERSGEQVRVDRLRQQAIEKHLDQYREVQVLGGKAYVTRARRAFEGSHTSVTAPLEGLRIGEAMQAVQRAIDAGEPLSRPTDPQP
jgi:putative addiction module CopG family antidote